MKSHSRVQRFATPWTAAYQAPRSMGFSSQEYWSGVPLPSPCSCTFHSNSQPRKSTFPKALVAGRTGVGHEELLPLCGHFLSLQSNSQESPPTPQFKGINSSALSFLHSPTLTSIHDTGKTIALTKWTFVGNIMSLLFAAMKLKDACSLEEKP